MQFQRMFGGWPAPAVSIKAIRHPSAPTFRTQFQGMQAAAASYPKEGTLFTSLHFVSTCYGSLMTSEDLRLTIQHPPHSPMDHFAQIRAQCSEARKATFPFNSSDHVVRPRLADKVAAIPPTPQMCIVGLPRPLQMCFIYASAVQPASASHGYELARTAMRTPLEALLWTDHLHTYLSYAPSWTLYSLLASDRHGSVLPCALWMDMKTSEDRRPLSTFTIDFHNRTVPSSAGS